MGLSALKGQQAAYSLIDDGSSDSCGVHTETAQHYLLECPLYAVIRRPLLQGVEGMLWSLGVVVAGGGQQTTSLLLNGSHDLSQDNNKGIISMAQTYIKLNK